MRSRIHTASTRARADLRSGVMPPGYDHACRPERRRRRVGNKLVALGWHGGACNLGQARGGAGRAAAAGAARLRSGRNCNLQSPGCSRQGQSCTSRAATRHQGGVLITPALQHARPPPHLVQQPEARAQREHKGPRVQGALPLGVVLLRPGVLVVGGQCPHRPCSPEEEKVGDGETLSCSAAEQAACWVWVLRLSQLAARPRSQRPLLTTLLRGGDGRGGHTQGTPGPPAGKMAHASRRGSKS